MGWKTLLKWPDEYIYVHYIGWRKFEAAGTRVVMLLMKLGHLFHVRIHFEGTQVAPLFHLSWTLGALSSFLLLSFVFPLPLQLPIKVGHQNTHTKVSTEHNKECLINISKYKFSLVISGLTTILKNVNNMVSGESGHVRMAV